jgi:hypothetical protein
MANIHEVIDSINDENVFEVKETLQKEANALHDSNKQLYARAKKAEGFEQKDGKWVKAPKAETPPENPEAKQSDEPDYGKLAYLETKGVSHPDDMKIVMGEAERLKMPVSEVLGMEHIKSKLKTAKEQREAEAGMPEGGHGKSSGAKGSVDYWVNKTTKDKDGNIVYDNPSDPELHNKVIEARVKSSSVNKPFDDSLD